MIFDYSADKNALLERERGVNFDDIIVAISAGYLIAVAPHPNKEKYPHQVVLYVQLSDGVYVVPCVQQGENIFMKTIYKSRVATKKFTSQ